MKKIAVFMSVLLVIMLAGCATPYKANGFGGGYSEVALNKDIYKVSFRGNGWTSSEKVRDLLLRRCADLTLQHNYKYFVILESNMDVRTSYTHTSSTTYTSTNDTYQGSVVGSQYVGSGSAYSISRTDPGTTYKTNRYFAVDIIEMLNDTDNKQQSYDAAIILSNFNSQ